VGIFFGLLLLATMAIPLSRKQSGEFVWAFSLFSEAAKEFDGWVNWFSAAYIGVWVTGAVLLVGGILFRKLPLALLYLVVASGMVVLLAGASQSDAKDARTIGFRSYLTGEPLATDLDGNILNDRSQEPLDRPVLGVAQKYKWPVVGLLGLFLAATSLRRKMGGFIPVCLLQILAAGGVLAVCAWSLVVLIPDYSQQIGKDRAELKERIEQAQSDEDQVKTWSFEFVSRQAVLLRPIYLAGAFALASVLSLLHGLSFSKKSRAPAGWALMLSWLSLLVWWLLSGMFPQVVTLIRWEQSAEEILFTAVLPVLPTLLVAWALAVVAVEALSGVPADIGAALGARPKWLDQQAPQTPPPPKPQPPQKPAGRTGVYRPPAEGPKTPPTPGQRLDQLKVLKDQGKITEEEYASRREEILKQL
jgi:hypothetical protein